MIVSILITSICVWLAYVLLCRRYFPVNEQVATCPGKWPLIGHALQLMNTKEATRNLMAFGEYSAKIGDVVTFYIGPIPVYVVTDPEDVATVANKCLDKLFVYRFIEPMVGKEMVAADVPTWKRNRKVLDLCFKQHILDDYLQLFNERAERFVETIAEDVGQGEVDLKKKISRSVLETTCRTTLGINRDGMNDINDNYAKAINDCLDTLSDRIYKPWLIVDAVFNLSSDKKKLDKALETIFEFSEKTVLLRKAERIQCLQKNEDLNHKGGFKSVLDVILENTITETKSAFTDTQLRNLMDNMLLAAFDTTIYQMNLVLVCIGSSSEVQDKILQEMNLILGKDGRLKGDNLSQLVYLDAVVKEAIRLYPVGPLVGRTTTAHTKLRNVTIPAGSSVVVHIWGTNRNPRQWGPDAEEFRPERWLDSTMPKHQAAFATFGPGKRGCVGKTYALMYIKATVVSLLRKYKITADHKKLKLECKIMFKPLSGHLIEIEERNK
ncbi:cytochrome P450 4C1-like [Spodoptera frugiperda]|uniref:Cytochrome P450 4C1-like n=1 Tax=Spodoptera frugiperda TaxID=7108 RepID=A0A9R0EY63_SPOFR|nr:cytochrome P450 4C1-like [Spodoptera frugiperda]